MKNLVVASFTAFVLASGSALAADLPYKAPPPPPPPVGWTGCYLSGGVGYGLWKQDHYAETDPGFIPITQTTTTGGEGWLGRVGGGCDFQAGAWVIGAFADYDFMNLNGSFEESVSGLIGNEKETGAWATGARFGYLVTPALLTYFDGGYTETHFNQINLFTNTVPSFATPFSISANTYHGWFLGGGTEYAISWLPVHGLFWKTEYRYASYQAADITIQPLAITGTAEHMQKDVQTFTTSLVWRFNFAGPVVSRY